MRRRGRGEVLRPREREFQELKAQDDDASNLLAYLYFNMEALLLSRDYSGSGPIGDVEMGLPPTQ